MPSLPPNEQDAVAHAALDAMDAQQLRALVRALIPWLDGATQARLMNEVVERAARASSGWTPTTPSEHRVTEIEAFVAAARRVHRAEPSAVDAHLREGTHAFLARDYTAASRIFRALLCPITSGEIDLGQRELVGEVLGVDIDACAQQYVLATYMTSSPEDRASAVCSAIDSVHDVGNFFEPLHQIEGVAVEPLPGFDAFLAQWRALVEARVATTKPRGGQRRVHGWRRELVARMEGSDGLAALARQTRHADDLQAWCRALAAAEDWKAARAAYEEAAERVEDSAFARREFLDGAALAAQELGADDLDTALERAWRGAPSLVRLQRWLGGCSTRASLRARAASALEAVPAQAERQRAFLHLVRSELGEAAALLANAKGLGWSSADHPGHLVFPLFVALLSGGELAVELPSAIDDMVNLIDDGRPKLHTPTLRALLQLASPDAPDDAVRRVMIAALRSAAASRVEGVTANTRRSHYGHAASLAVQAARADGSAEGRAWLRALMDAHRSYTALTRAFKAAGA